jgi:hypothetical protein
MIGLLSAIFILPEVYGFEQDAEPAHPDNLRANPGAIG